MRSDVYDKLSWSNIVCSFLVIGLGAAVTGNGNLLGMGRIGSLVVALAIFIPSYLSAAFLFHAGKGIQRIYPVAMIVFYTLMWLPAVWWRFIG